MTDLCFVDANVLVYLFDPRDAVKQARADAWREVLWHEHRGRTSVQAISEAYVTLKRLQGGAKNDMLWEEMARYLAWDPQPVDAAVLQRAHEIELRWKVSWWDCLIVAAAQVQNCELLLSEDFQDGMQFGSVTARSPFTLEARQPAPRYELAAAVVSDHRPRGRPRRSATVTA